jgi:AraC family transcriptional regulator
MRETRQTKVPAALSEGASRPTVPSVEWSSVKLDHHSTLPGELVEYRPTANTVVLATGAKGDMQVVLANAPLRHVEVSPGQVHILPANVPVAIRLFEPSESIVVTLHNRLLAEGNASQVGMEVQLRSGFGLDDALIRQLVFALEEEADAPNADSRYVQSLGAALAAHLVRKYASCAQEYSPQRRQVMKPGLADVLDYIDQNIDGRLTLPKLAEVARLSIFALVRSFKTSTGLPPHRYILRKRVEHAKVLLSDAALSIGDVALRCGFGDQSAFTTTFRRITNQTPSAYRDSLR